MGSRRRKAPRQPERFSSRASLDAPTSRRMRRRIAAASRRRSRRDSRSPTAGFFAWSRRKRITHSATSMPRTARSPARSNVRRPTKAAGRFGYDSQNSEALRRPLVMPAERGVVRRGWADNDLPPTREIVPPCSVASRCSASLRPCGRLGRPGHALRASVGRPLSSAAGLRSDPRQRGYIKRARRTPCRDVSRSSSTCPGTSPQQN